jgi:type II secretory pathway predicted ATPase ExeA
MYEKHFGLKRRIFRGNAAGTDVFVGPQTASIVSDIAKAMARSDAVVTLTGPVGCGKSTAVAHALGTISGKNAVVRVGRYPMQCGELLDLIFDHLRIKQRPQRGNQKLALFRQLLFNLARNGSRMFVLVEDAPFFSPEILAELEVVTAPDTGPSDGANLVLMGDEFLKELLTSRSLTRLRQRVRLRRTLDPSSVDEITGYLRHCFRQAGGDFDKIFADGASELLHKLSGGILRVVNNLVDSSLESAANAKSAIVDLGLVNRIADEEFGLTGKFTRLPEISDDQAETQFSDDTTTKLVALSLPETETDEQPAPQDNDDDIPQLIQDTQPALAILNDAPPPAKPAAKRRKQDTLPDIEPLPAEFGAEPPSPEAAEPTEPGQANKETTPTEPKPASAAVDKPKPKPETAQQPKPEPEAGQKPEQKPRPAPWSEKAEKQPDTGKPAAPEPGIKLDLEKKPEPAADTPIPTLSEKTLSEKTLSEDETPAWDRDPTLAELRPDLDALERAMAVAQGRDSATGDEPAPPSPAPLAKEQPKDDIEEIPEITLDDSINRKVDRAALEKKQRLENEPSDKEKHPAKDRAGDKKGEADLEEIAAGLAQAKTIDDVDDKMAETLFGEELSVAAAAVAARVAEEAAAAAAEATTAPQEPAAPAHPPKSEMEKEFANVWGETPGVEVYIDSAIEDQKRGLDISASRRLATVRALNTGKPNAAPQKAANAAPPPPTSPDPIEEQITTSLTQTMKALKVNPDPAAINDDDDDDDGRKGGFFSRFRRS